MNASDREEPEDITQLQQKLDAYRRAAEMSLEQLDACADYLVDMRRPDLARGIRRNRSQIRRTMDPEVWSKKG